MTKKFWKVHAPLKLRYPGTQTFETAGVDEIVEERVETGISATPEAEVRVYRRHKEFNDFHSFIVSRTELDASAKPVGESDAD